MLGAVAGAAGQGEDRQRRHGTEGCQKVGAGGESEEDGDVQHGCHVP